MSSSTRPSIAIARKKIVQRALLTTAVIVLVLGTVAIMLWTGRQRAAFVFYRFIAGSALGSPSEVVSELEGFAGAAERIVVNPAHSVGNRASYFYKQLRRADKMRRICLVTHAEAEHSVANKVGGWYNSELTARGKEKAKSLKDKIAELGFDLSSIRAYSSDLRRCRQTAELIFASVENKIIFDKRLREMSFGDNEGLDQALHDTLMTPVCANADRLDHRICGGAETRRELASRVASFIDEVVDKSGDMLIVTHGFSAIFVVAAFQKIDIDSLGYISYKFTPGSISILEVDDLFNNGTLSLLNA